MPNLRLYPNNRSLLGKKAPLIAALISLALALVAPSVSCLPLSRFRDRHRRMIHTPALTSDRGRPHPAYRTLCGAPSNKTIRMKTRTKARYNQKFLARPWPRQCQVVIMRPMMSKIRKAPRSPKNDAEGKVHQREEREKNRKAIDHINQSTRKESKSRTQERASRPPNFRLYCRSDGRGQYMKIRIPQVQSIQTRMSFRCHRIAMHD